MWKKIDGFLALLLLGAVASAGILMYLHNGKIVEAIAAMSAMMFALLFCAASFVRLYNLLMR